MQNRNYILSMAMLGLLGLYIAPTLAEPGAHGFQIEDIDDKRSTIVANDIAYSLAPNLVVRDASGKPVSRSALRKGVRFSATSQREPDKHQSVITEIQLLGAGEQR